MRKTRFILVVIVCASWIMLPIIAVTCCNEPQPSFTDSFMQLQEQAGTSPDGLLGPDSIKCIRAKLERELFDSYARPYITGEAYK